MRTIKEGVLVATSTVDGRVIGYDHYRVVEKTSRIDVFSRQVSCDDTEAVVYSHHHLEPDWTPRRVEVHSNRSSVGFHFADDQVTMEIKRASEPAVVLDLPIGRQRALVLTQPIYGMPIHVLNRCDPSDPTPQYFDVVPTGSCMVRAAGRVPSVKGARSALDMQISAPGYERNLRLIVDGKDNLLACVLEHEQLSLSVRPSLPSS
jgi:hypothetical protein